MTFITETITPPVPFPKSRGIRSQHVDWEACRDGASLSLQGATRVSVDVSEFNNPIFRLEQHFQAFEIPGTIGLVTRATFRIAFSFFTGGSVDQDFNIEHTIRDWDGGDVIAGDWLGDSPLGTGTERNFGVVNTADLVTDEYYEVDLSLGALDLINARRGQTDVGVWIIAYPQTLRDNSYEPNLEVNDAEFHWVLSPSGDPLDPELVLYSDAPYLGIHI